MQKINGFHTRTIGTNKSCRVLLAKFWVSVCSKWIAELRLRADLNFTYSLDPGDIYVYSRSSRAVKLRDVSHKIHFIIQRTSAVKVPSLPTQKG